MTSILPALLVAAPGVSWVREREGSKLVLSLCSELFPILNYPKTSPEQEFFFPNPRNCRESGKLGQSPQKSAWGDTKCR